MRSSIACIRCRRSKVKCVNNGVGTTCRSCENSGRECQYPDPVTVGTRRRDSLSGKGDGYGDSESHKRPRKGNHTFVGHHTGASSVRPRSLVDALDPTLLTPAVWQELFDIFQTHYSADLPFLHPPTFLKPLRHANLQPSSTEGSTPARPPGSPEFLLAFLSLTARFHPKLVAHFSPPASSRQSNPLIASEYYAAAATERLSVGWNDHQIPDIERTQAILMLGLHEWGMCRGARAWLTIGNATRSAQALGLQYEMDLDDEPLSRALALESEVEHMGPDARRTSASAGKGEGEAFVEQEIRRRTFWSCYIMDRYLSSGKYRPQMLHAKELRIQLPASERSFLFAEKVRTLMLGEEDDGVGVGLSIASRAQVRNQRKMSVMFGISGTPEPKMAPTPKSTAINEALEDKGRLETGPDEGLVSRYIKILEIYGRVVKWSCGGGRRLEEHPPWDSRCEFYQLRKQCADFKASLPRQNTLTPQNTQAHISLKTSTPYTLVHSVYLLCQIMLHREYVPFLPIQCSKPEGPLDPPLFPADKYDVPAGFWDESAKECFKSARDIMDLVRSCQEWNALVETPIIGFAIYTVAFVGVYCINFPHMDPDGFMCTPRSTESDQKPAKLGESKGFEAAQKALEMIGQMRPRLHMADGWFNTINRMHRYFRKMRSDYKKNVAQMESSTNESVGSPTSTRYLSLREGGAGGGLNEYKLLERTLKDFGNLDDRDVEMEEGGHQPSNRALDEDSNSIVSLKSEEPGKATGNTEQPRSDPGGPWNAINAAPTGDVGRREESSTPASGAFRSYDSYHQAPQPPQPAQLQPQPPNYAQQINSFRPGSFSQDNQSVQSHGSPASHLSPHSQPTPSLDRHHSYPGGWTPQQTSYPMPPQPAYPNGVSSYSHHGTPIQSAPAYPTPTGQPQLMQSVAPMHEQHHPWSQMDKDAWFNSLDTRLGGDDIAAFVDGGDLAEWANMSAHRGFGGGWLSTVWGGGSGVG